MSEVQEENKALVRRFVEAQAKGDLDAVKEMMAPDFVARSLLPGQQPQPQRLLAGNRRVSCRLL